MAIRRYQVRGRRAPVTGVSAKTSQTNPISFVKGLHTGNPNDLQPDDTLRYVTDMRYKGFGKFETRQGNDFYTVPVGQTINVQQTSVAGAGDVTFNNTTRIAEKVTATADGVITRVDINLKNDASATGTVIVEMYSNVSGNPGALLSRSSIDEATITASYAYSTTYMIKAPAVATSDVVWVVAYVQEFGTGSFSASTTTNTTNAKTSADGGQTWTAASYSLNVKVHTSTAGPVKGLTRVYRPNGTAATFFAHGTNVYKVTDSDGSVASIDSTISASSTNVRFEFVQDVLYYVDGFSKPHKYNWTASSIVTAAPYNASHIIEHVGILFFVDATDRNRFFWSNFGLYEVFTSTDFQYAPAPNSSDDIKALAKLNGVLYIITRNNKYMLMGKRTATFRLDNAYGQKGTFSQESVVYDLNSIFLASDDGIYQFNGTYEKNIAENIITDYTAILTKSDITLQTHNNKLYTWYRPNGAAQVSECFVYNVLYDVWESRDLNTPIAVSFSRLDTEDLFLQASNRAGVVFYSERVSNDYVNLGDRLSAEARTSYQHFGTPQQRKRITYWRPIIQNQAGSYSMKAGFAADYSNDFNFVNVALQGTGFVYDDAASLYDAITYARSAAGTDTTLEIYGSAQRWQRAYKHHAAREPFEFAGEVLTVQTRRLR